MRGSLKEALYATVEHGQNGYIVALPVLFKDEAALVRFQCFSFPEFFLAVKRLPQVIKSVWALSQYFFRNG